MATPINDAVLSDHFADARKNMVDSQIRPNRVTDPRILAAMRRLPRERFLPANVVSLAYADEDIPLGNGRFMLEPMVLARMLQAASLRDNEHVLVVGAGSGYSVAVLAACGCRVTALEDDPALVKMANEALLAEAPGVTVIPGPLAAGWSAVAPFDLILIEGAVAEIPAALVAQTHRQTGRILAAICKEGCITQAVIAEATPAGLSFSTLFDCATQTIPSLRSAVSFAF